MRGLVASLLVALLIAGCGGSGSSSASAYRATANAACRRERSTIVSLASRAGREHLDAAEVVPLLEAANARLLKAMRALRPPSSLAAGQTRLLAAMQAQGAEHTVTVTSLAAAASVLASERVRVRRLVFDERALGLGACVRIAREQPPRLIT